MQPEDSEVDCNDPTNRDEEAATDEQEKLRWRVVTIWGSCYDWLQALLGAESLVIATSCSDNWCRGGPAPQLSSIETSAGVTPPATLWLNHQQTITSQTCSLAFKYNLIFCTNKAIVIFAGLILMRKLGLDHHVIEDVTCNIFQSFFKLMMRFWNKISIFRIIY